MLPAHPHPHKQRHLERLGGERCSEAAGMLGRCQGHHSCLFLGCPAHAVLARTREHGTDSPRANPAARAHGGSSSPMLVIVKVLLVSVVPKPAWGPRRRERSRESFSLAHAPLLLLRKPLPGISPGTRLPRRGRTSISPKLPWKPELAQTKAGTETSGCARATAVVASPWPCFEPQLGIGGGPAILAGGAEMHHIEKLRGIIRKEKLIKIKI